MTDSSAFGLLPSALGLAGTTPWLSLLFSARQYWHCSVLEYTLVCTWAPVVGASAAASTSFRVPLT